MKKGFTIIEILVALLSISIISLFSFEYLANTVRIKDSLSNQSTIQQKYMNAINIMRLDLMQLVRVPIKDVNGRQTNAVFFGSNDKEIMSFVAFIGSSEDFNESKLRRIEYRYENNNLYRSTSPSNRPSKKLSNELLYQNIDGLKISFREDLDDNYNQWPNNNNSIDAVPRYVVLELTIDGTERTIILSSFQ